MSDEMKDENDVIEEVDGKPSFWWYFYGPPLIGLFCALHFSICVFAMIRYRTDERRRKFYEYYSPWGWGKRR